MLDSEINYSRSAQAAIEGTRMRSANWLLLSILSFTILMLVWSNFAIIDEVTRGFGKVIPSSSVHVIQSLEGGILADLQVKVGDRVEKGDVLLRIDDTQFASSFQENVSMRDVLEAKIARLAAESTGEEVITFPLSILQSRPDLVAREKQLFLSRQETVSEQIQTFQKSLDLAEAEMKMTRPLTRSGVVSKVEELRLEREINELEGSVKNVGMEFRKLALEEEDLARAELEKLVESIKGHQDRVSRTTMVAPVTGLINTIHVKTVGGVIASGQPIMEIVPTDDTLLVEANIRPGDIAFLTPLQKAKVKLTAYDFTIYGGLEGQIEHISADTILEETSGERFYQIKVRTDRNALSHRGEELPIIPGMITEVDVLTGRRSILQYLLKPINRARGRALTER